MTTTDAPPLHGIPAPALIPGTEPWLKTMSASKVAAVLGLSPYESRYSLWHRMANLLPGEEADHLARGHYLEDGVLAWFKDQHPDWTITKTGAWAHPDEPTFTASPDGEACLPDGEVRGVEVKTAADDLEWGEEGTDQIPPGYRAQVIWQMYVRGTRTTHIAVLSAYLQMREYIVAYDQDEADYIAAECRAFLDTLPGRAREQRPSIDEHNATYEAVRKLHPDIEPLDIELDPETVRHFCHAKDLSRRAKAADTYAKALVLDELGSGRRGLFNGQVIATRQPHGDSTKLVAARSLPTFEQEAAAS